MAYLNFSIDPIHGVDYIPEQVINIFNKCDDINEPQFVFDETLGMMICNVADLNEK